MRREEGVGPGKGTGPGTSECPSESNLASLAPGTLDSKQK
jgi:hypothetical protein